VVSRGSRVVAILPWVLGMAGGAARAATSDGLTPPVRAACANVAACRPSCEGVPSGEDQPVYSAVGEFPGFFSAPGVEEAIVSLFPCGETLSRRQEGLTALVKKERSRWTTVSTIEDAFTQDECRHVDVEGRQRLLCHVGVGPDQGILTDTLCVVSVRDGALVQACPLRVTDVTGAGCFADHESPGRRHTWVAEIKGWTPATVGRAPGARVEVSVAAVAVPAGDGLDPACERAVQKLEKAPRETLTLDLVLGERGLALTPMSRKTATRFPWAIEGDE
jgi:hypothetical protein